MSITRRIDAAARRSRRLMIDTCTITRSAGEGTFNPVTLGHDATPAPTEIYHGCCLVQVRRSGDTVDIGDQDVTAHLYDVYLPPEATGIGIDDVVTIDESGDEDLRLATLRVVDVTSESMLPARQVTCQRNLG